MFRLKLKAKSKKLISFLDEDTNIAKIQKGSCGPITSPCSPCSPCNPICLSLDCCAGLGVGGCCSLLAVGGLLNFLRCCPQDDCCYDDCYV
jgi:hypothetical protein